MFINDYYSETLDEISPQSLIENHDLSSPNSRRIAAHSMRSASEDYVVSGIELNSSEDNGEVRRRIGGLLLQDHHTPPNEDSAVTRQRRLSAARRLGAMEFLSEVDVDSNRTDSDATSRGLNHTNVAPGGFEVSEGDADMDGRLASASISAMIRITRPQPYREEPAFESAWEPYYPRDIASSSPHSNARSTSSGTSMKKSSPPSLPRSAPPPILHHSNDDIVSDTERHERATAESGTHDVHAFSDIHILNPSQVRVCVTFLK